MVKLSEKMRQRAGTPVAATLALALTACGGGGSGGSEGPVVDPDTDGGTPTESADPFVITVGSEQPEAGGALDGTGGTFVDVPSTPSGNDNTSTVGDGGSQPEGPVMPVEGVDVSGNGPEDVGVSNGDPDGVSEPSDPSISESVDTQPEVPAGQPPVEEPSLPSNDAGGLVPVSTDPVGNDSPVVIELSGTDIQSADVGSNALLYVTDGATFPVDDTRAVAGLYIEKGVSGGNVYITIGNWIAPNIRVGEDGPYLVRVDSTAIDNMNIVADSLGDVHFKNGSLGGVTADMVGGIFSAGGPIGTLNLDNHSAGFLNAPVEGIVHADIDSAKDGFINTNGIVMMRSVDFSANGDDLQGLTFGTNVQGLYLREAENECNVGLRAYLENRSIPVVFNVGEDVTIEQLIEAGTPEARQALVESMGGSSVCLVPDGPAGP